MENKIRITYEDLNHPDVDKTLARYSEESTSRRGSGIPVSEFEKVSLIHKSWFYLMIAGSLGALIAWGFVEPLLNDFDDNFDQYAMLLIFSVGGMISLMIGCTEGILARNFSRAIKTGFIGFLIGLIGAFASMIVVGITATIIAPMGVAIIGEEAAADPINHFSGFVFLIVQRGILWTIIGMTFGLGPGIVLKSKKLVLNGFIGGMIGGAIGGLLFDPINYLLSGGTFETGVEVSRGVGFCILGASAGLFIGIVEMLTKEAWLIMIEGPLKGKQFIIYKNVTAIGSSPKCDIYLFKDSKIDPFHATINIIRDYYEIEDSGSNEGVLINGKKIKRERLLNGDEIQIGAAKFIYAEKDKKK